MKRILILLIILCFSQNALAGGVIFTAGGVESVGGDYTDVILYLNADGSLSAPTYTLDSTETGPATATSSSQAKVSIASALVGTNGFEFPSTADAFNTVVNLDTGLFQFAIRLEFPTLPADNAELCGIENTSTSRRTQVMVDSSGATAELEVSWRDNGGTYRAATTTSLDIQIDKEYIVLVEVNSTTPSNKISVYNTSFTLLDSAESTVSYTKPVANYNNAYIQSDNSSDIYMDNFMISDLSNTRNFITDTISSVRLIDRNDTPN